MLIRDLKYLLPLLPLALLFSIHSAQASTVQRPFADARSITLAKILNVGEFFQDLRELVLPASSHSVHRERQNTKHVVRTTRRVQRVQSNPVNRQTAGIGNFIAWSPGKEGHLISVPQTADKHNRQLDDGNGNEPLSSDAEPVTILESEPAKSGSDHDDMPEDADANANISMSKSPRLSSGSKTSASPTPEADVHLDVTKDAGNPRDSISIDRDPEPTVEIPENTFEVELNVVGPSIGELYNAKGTDFVSPENDDHDGSDIEKQSNSEDLNPQPSAAPGPIEQPLIIVPPDTEEGETSSDPHGLDDSAPFDGANPAVTIPFDSLEATEATPESASLEPQDLGARSPLKADGNPSSPPSGESVEEPAVRSILVDLPLNVRLSEQSIPRELDGHARSYLGQTTGTTAGQWKPTKVSSTTRTVQRQGGFAWEITYQGKLSEATAQQKVDKLEERINDGHMNTYLSKRLSTEVTIRTASAPILDAPQKEDVSETGTEPKETSSGNATANTEEKGGQSLGLILGTCFGLFGALIAAAAGFALMRRRRGTDEHMLDGVATVPTTLTSFETDRSESQFRSGAPAKPRGPNVLRNQSRILDWQMDQATAPKDVRHIEGNGNGRDDNV